MTRVYACYTDTSLLCLVVDEGKELRKAPTMQAALSLSFTRGDTFSNIRQILKDNRASWGCILDNAFTENMVMVTMLPKPFTRKVVQVPFGRLRACLLQFSLESEDAPFLFLPYQVLSIRWRETRPIMPKKGGRSHPLHE